VPTIGIRQVLLQIFQILLQLRWGLFQPAGDNGFGRVVSADLQRRDNDSPAFGSR
jgi:hypothetical protein